MKGITEEKCNSNSNLKRSYLPIPIPINPVNPLKLKAKVGDSAGKVSKIQIQSLPFKSKSEFKSTSDGNSNGNRRIIARHYQEEEVEEEFPEFQVEVEETLERSLSSPETGELFRRITIGASSQNQSQSHSQHEQLQSSKGKQNDSMMEPIKIKIPDIHPLHSIPNLSKANSNDKKKTRGLKLKELESELEMGRKYRNNNFKLFPCPNESQFLDEGDRKKIWTRSQVGKLLRVNSLRYPHSTPIKSKLVIRKKLEFFPNRSGDHHICYFTIKNKFHYIQAYHISTNRLSNYAVTPSTAYVPPGRSVNICLKVLKRKLNGDQLEKDSVIIKNFVPPKGVTFRTNLLKEFQRLEVENACEENTVFKIPVSRTCFQLKNFVVHPCSIASSNCSYSSFKRSATTRTKKTTNYNVGDNDSASDNDNIENVFGRRGSGSKSLLVNNAPLSINEQRLRRLEKLRSRNFGEKVFNQVQTAAAVSLKELKKCQRRAEMLRRILAVLTYLVFISTLAFAGYLCSFGPKLKPEFLINNPHPHPQGSHIPDSDSYSEAPVLFFWKYWNVPVVTRWSWPWEWFLPCRDYLQSSASIIFHYFPNFPYFQSQVPFASSSSSSLPLEKSFSGFYSWASEGFQTFLQHPISSSVNWLAQHSPL